MINKFKDRIIRIFRKYSLPRWLVFLIDSVIVLATFMFACMLRFNLVISAIKPELAWRQGLLVLGLYAIVMLIVKSYSGLIRQTTIKDTFNIIITTTVSTATLIIIDFINRKSGQIPLFNIPLSILLIHYGIVTIILIFFRVFIKMFYEFASQQQGKEKTLSYTVQEKWVLLLERMIDGEARSGLRAAVMIDDNWRLQGKKVDGIQVYSQAILTRISPCGTE